MSLVRRSWRRLLIVGALLLFSIGVTTFTTVGNASAMCVVQPGRVVAQGWNAYPFYHWIDVHVDGYNCSYRRAYAPGDCYPHRYYTPGGGGFCYGQW